MNWPEMMEKPEEVPYGSHVSAFFTALNNLDGVGGSDLSLSSNGNPFEGIDSVSSMIGKFDDLTSDRYESLLVLKKTISDLKNTSPDLFENPESAYSQALSILEEKVRE